MPTTPTTEARLDRRAAQDQRDQRPGRPTIVVRREVGPGIGWLVLSALLLPLGGVCVSTQGGSALPLLFGLLVLGVGAANLFPGLYCVADRSPVLTLGEEEVIDHRGSGPVTYENILEASLSHTAGRGAEVLKLKLHQPVAGVYEVNLYVHGLDRTGQEVLRLIAERAELG